LINHDNSDLGIPCDLGVHFAKKEFDGDLGYLETFVQLDTGPAVSFLVMIGLAVCLIDF
jgi:hypothetical protein